MFDQLNATPPDPILSLMAEFRADQRERKIDLGVGVYQDDSGATPVMAAVRSAEAQLYAAEQSKTYQGIAGNPAFGEVMLAQLFGADSPLLASGRARFISTPGGSGALRLGGELLRRANSQAQLLVGTPTWPNHIPLLGSTGLPMVEYNYLDGTRSAVDMETLQAALQAAKPGDVVLLHGCCHNPSGVDLSPAQWLQIVELCKQGGLIPFVDVAYLGLGEGLAADGAPLRLLAEQLPEFIVASSCSKNFGLYRERTGGLAIIAQSAAAAERAANQAMAQARQIWSMPPAHGADIVATLLADSALAEQWRTELEAVRQRIVAMRRLLVERANGNRAGIDFSAIIEQRGMFSFLGISPAQVVALREQHGVYMIDSTRINLAGINSHNIDHLSEALHAVLV